MGSNTGSGSSWFGPGQPMTPTAPPQVEGRQFDFPAAYNVVTQPRAYQPITFGVLRAFANSYDLLRLAIETRKDQVESLRWKIVPRDDATSGTNPDEFKDEIKEATEFFRYPDKRHSWARWLRMVLEDLFVLDAVSLYRRKTRGGKLYALQPLDGATIKPIIDDYGMTPTAPYPAYQQVLKGLPAVNYTDEDLLYYPRNLRTNEVYGYGPVEQILMTVNIGLRRQVFQLNYFTEGNMPEALIGVPETWTPDQIRTFQEWFDNILAGNLAQKRRARFVPNAVGKTYIPTKDTELFGKAEEWLARIVCYAFSLPPTPFINQVNRATSDTAQQVAINEGLIPLKNYIKDLIDGVIDKDLGLKNVMFMWDEEEELDAEKRQKIISGYMHDGLMTVNEGRIARGAKPYPDKQYDEPMFLTNNGLAPLIARDLDLSVDPGAEGKAIEAAAGHPNVALPENKADGAAGKTPTTQTKEKTDD